MRRAQEADPLSLIANAALGWSFYFAGKYEAALDQCRSTLALDPNYALAHLWGAWALEALGQPQEARQWISRALEIAPGNELARLSLAHILAGSSPSAAQDSARVILRAIEARADGGAYVPSYEVAKVHLALGDRAAALRWLERAVDERSHSRAFLRVDPQLRPLRGDARFEQVVARAFGTARRGSDGERARAEREEVAHFVIGVISRVAGVLRRYPPGS
jgi:tetratricopeptide (TPR) repeat protein